MAKRYDEPIEVSTDDSGWDPHTPLAFAWRGRRYYVDERLSSWREAGQWWRAAASAGAPNESGPQEREYFRVVAHPAGSGSSGQLDADGFIINNSSVYDIYRDRINGIWRMGRVWD